MAKKFLVPIDLNSNEIRNVLAHILGSDPGSPTEGQFWYNSTSKVLKFRTNSATIVLGRLDQITAPTGDVSLNGHKITDLGTPSADDDAATKAYVDSIAQGGVYWKNPVRVLVTTNVNISNPGTSTFDGVSLSTGDRVALVGQSTGSQNGIYDFNGSGSAMTRSADANSDALVKSGMSFWVDEGTTNGDSAWVLTTNDPITLDTTSLTFVQFSGLGQITAGNGLTKSGNTLNVVGTSGRIVANADSIDLADTIVTPGTYESVTVDTYGRVTGGTNPSRTGKYSALIGNGSSTSIAVTQATHGLASNGQMIAAAYDASTGDEVLCDISINNSNGTVTFTFSVAPASNAIRIVIIG